MSETILGKINCSKIDKTKLFKGRQGMYLDVLIMENRNGPDEYGNTHMIVQSVTKEEREKGIKGAILGNGKFLKRATAPRPEPPTTESGPVGSGDNTGDDVPF